MYFHIHDCQLCRNLRFVSSITFDDARFHFYDWLSHPPSNSAQRRIVRCSNNYFSFSFSRLKLMLDNLLQNSPFLLSVSFFLFLFDSHHVRASRTSSTLQNVFQDNPAWWSSLFNQSGASSALTIQLKNCCWARHDCLCDCCAWHTEWRCPPCANIVMRPSPSKINSSCPINSLKRDNYVRQVLCDDETLIKVAENCFFRRREAMRKLPAKVSRTIWLGWQVELRFKCHEFIHALGNAMERNGHIRKHNSLG